MLGQLVGLGTACFVGMELPWSTPDTCCAQRKDAAKDTREDKSTEVKSLCNENWKMGVSEVKAQAKILIIARLTMDAKDQELHELQSFKKIGVIL